MDHSQTLTSSSATHILSTRNILLKSICNFLRYPVDTHKSSTTAKPAWQPRCDSWNHSRQWTAPVHTTNCSISLSVSAVSKQFFFLDAKRHRGPFLDGSILIFALVAPHHPVLGQRVSKPLWALLVFVLKSDFLLTLHTYCRTCTTVNRKHRVARQIVQIN